MRPLHALQALVLTVLGPHCHAEYSEDLARKMVLLSDAAYCGDHTYGSIGVIQNWTCQVGHSYAVHRAPLVCVLRSLCAVFLSASVS